MKTLKVLLVVVLAVACADRVGNTTNITYVCQNFQKVGKKDLTWKKDDQVHIFINKSVPSEFREDVREAVSQWNKILKKDILIVEDKVDQGNEINHVDGLSVIYFDASYDPRHWIDGGSTTRRWDDSYIVESDIMINVNSNKICKKPAKKCLHFKSLILHELGHLLGLEHINDPYSIMYPLLAEGEVKEEIAVQEELSLTCAYK